MPSLIAHAGGAEHPPEGDIQAIRDLLHGYGTDRSLLKELIQNAEDAESTKLCLTIHPGWTSGAPHPLLATPGLRVVNNGRFTQQDLLSMQRFGLGTKGKDNKAIGRFGKGLKSVFAVCEAFFIIAKTKTEDWPEGKDVCQLFSPWKEWFHADWLKDFEKRAENIFRLVNGTVGSFSDAPWLTLWIPLRHAIQRDHKAKWIYEDAHQLPGEDPHYGRRLVAALEELAPHLATLRFLKEITLEDLLHGPCATWRHNRGSRPSPPETCVEETPAGSMQWEDSTEGKPTEITYLASFGTLRSNELAQLKERRDWPKIVVPNTAADSIDVPAKGEPHFGALLSANPTKTGSRQGRLTLNWAVFLPVSYQPGDEHFRPLETLPYDLNLTLHGFAFLDSQRTRIDWLSERFRPQSPVESESCLAWNRALFEEGALPAVPALLHRYFEETKLSDTQKCEVVETVKTLWLWGQPSSELPRERVFRDALCSHKLLLRRWLPAGHEWCLEKAGAATTERMRQFCPPPRSSIAEKLPGLNLLATELLLLDSTVGSLISAEPPPVCCRDWVVLLKDCRLNASDTNLADWIVRGISALGQQGPFDNDLVALLEPLPIHTVFDTRLGSEIRVSVQQIREKIAQDRCFMQTDQAAHWCECLNQALGDFSCWLVNSIPPPWARLANLQSLSSTTISILLSLTPRLAVPESRRRLVEELLPHRTPSVRQAIRYLLHGCPDQIEGDEWLQVEEPGNPLWAELIQNVLAKQPVWTVLDKSWGGLFAGDAATWLHLAPLNALGVWDLLNHHEVNWGEVTFTEPAWSNHKLNEVLLGLYEAGASHPPELKRHLLRRLPLHCLQQNSGNRVSIATSDGSLDRKFVLHSPNFGQDLPEELQGEWATFLNDCALIKRQPQATHAAVQLELFGIEGDGQERVPWELGWNYILRRCLESEEPGRRAKLIDFGLTLGDQHHRGLGQIIRSTAWLPLKEGGHIPPEKVVYFPGLGTYLRSLGDFQRDDWTSEVALADWLTPSVNSHLPRFLARPGRALELLSKWAKDKPQWALGFELKALPNGDRTIFLQQTEGMSNLPASKLIAELCRVPSDNAESWFETVWTELGYGLCRPFERNDEGLKRIRGILTSLAANRHRAAFDVYLRQIAKDGQDTTLLPDLELVSKSGAWVAARHLIWPAEGVDPSVQLCDLQSKILKPAGDEKGQSTLTGNAWRDPGSELKEKPDFDKQADDLIKYLEPFASGQVGPLVTAALVVVLGPLQKLKKHVASLLELSHSPLGYDAFFADLMGDRQETIAWIEKKQRRFIFEFVDGESLQCISLTGEKFTANLSTRVDSLLVGSTDDLARPRWGQYATGWDCHLVRLRRFKDPESLENAVPAFAKTIDLILEWVQGRGPMIAHDCPPDIQAYLESQDSGQTDLRRSQSYLFQSAESRLGELGARRMSSLANILRKFEDSRIKQVEADSRRGRSSIVATGLENEARSLRQSANEALKEILNGQSQTARIAKCALVGSLRHKMSDFQYSPESVLVELFQNADDAAVELAEMVAASDHEPSFSVRIDLAEKFIEVVHWGRPINYCRAGFSAGEQKGYRQDLPKMLTLNFSDKGSDDDQQPANTTGRFGLGFKSVFFLADEPEVLSDRIGFRIVAGFYPQALTSEEMKQHRTRASVHALTPKVKPTIFRLNWQHDERTILAASAVEHFRKQAHLFALFSRSIRQITLIDDKSSCSLKPELIPLGVVEKVELAKYSGGQSYLVFRCCLNADNRPASLVFTLGPEGISTLPATLSRIWITTPLNEHTDAGWALNAPFSPDPGRQRIALENPKNLVVAKQIASVWQRQLEQLALSTATSWEPIKALLALSHSHSLYQFWSSLWKVLSTPKIIASWESAENGGHMPSWLAWDSTHGAYRGLLGKYPVVPSHLPGSYETLCAPSKITHRLADALAIDESPAWESISAWPRFQTRHPPGTLASPSVTGRLAVSGLIKDLPVLGLVEVVQSEVGEDGYVSPACAEQLGNLFIRCSAMANGADSNRASFLRLEDALSEMKFLACDGSRKVPGDLVVCTVLDNLIEHDEILRSAFAPDHARLSNEYGDLGIVAFTKSRKRLGADAQTMKEWVQIITDGAELSAVFSYLLEGNLRQELADQLRFHWLNQTAKQSGAWKKLSAADANEICRLFNSPKAAGVNTSVAVLHKDEIMFDDAPLRQEIDSDEAMRCISAWWRDEGQAQQKTYANNTYPANHPGSFPWLDTEEWDKQSYPSAASDWLILFADAALAALGLNKIGRNKRFLEHLVQQHLAEALVAEKIDADKIVSSLDAYFQNASDNLRSENTFQFRQFLPIYGFGRFLRSYHETIKHLDLHGTDAGDFANLLSPNSVVSLQGTGIRGADLGSFIGIGRCQLLRELYRLGRISNNAGYPFAYVPIRKTRRLFCQLFGKNPGKGITASPVMFYTLSALGQKYKADPTFGRCFDLPLQILAEDRRLRDRVLNTSFEVEVDETKEINDAITQGLQAPSL